MAALGGKAVPQPCRGHAPVLSSTRPRTQAGTRACTLPCGAPRVAAGRLLAHFFSCSWGALTLHLLYHPPVTPPSCRRLSHLLWLQVVVQEPRNREASQVPVRSKGKHAAFGGSRNPRKHADPHLRCYVASGPQGGQYFKPKTPQAMKSNSSHGLPSIKGN